MKKSVIGIAGIALASLLITGCTATNESETETSGGSALTSDRTCEDVVPAPANEPPTTVSQTVPLSATPPEDMTVAVVRNATAQWDFYGAGFEEAGEALGWNVETFIYDTDQAGALQMAINSNPDYIVGASLQIDAVQNQLNTAQEMGIPFVDSGGERPSEPENDFYALHGVGDTYLKQLADWNINDSCGTATAVYVAPFSLPYFTGARDTIAEHYEEMCEECTFDSLDISLEALAAGEVPGILASYLQTNPDVDYVMFGFDSAAPGVGAALDNAGLLETVKLTGVGATGPQLREMTQGTQAAWIAVPADSYGWGTLDVLARLSVGDDPMLAIEEVNAAGHSSPTWVIDSVEQAEELAQYDFGWPGAEGYEEQYMELWQVN